MEHPQTQGVLFVFLSALLALIFVSAAASLVWGDPQAQIGMTAGSIDDYYEEYEEYYEDEEYEEPEDTTTYAPSRSAATGGQTPPPLSPPGMPGGGQQSQPSGADSASTQTQTNTTTLPSPTIITNTKPVVSPPRLGTPAVVSQPTVSTQKPNDAIGAQVTTTTPAPGLPTSVAPTPAEKRRQTSIQPYTVGQPSDTPQSKTTPTGSSKPVTRPAVTDKTPATDRQPVATTIEPEEVQPPAIVNANKKLRERKTKFDTPTKLFEDRKKQKTHVLVDSDRDGISDYDEITVYGTDPYNARTASGTMSDGERLLQGLNPLSTTTNPIFYEDPRDLKITVEETFKVLNMHFATSTSEAVQDKPKVLTMRGTAVPNAFITLYIFSTPIVVTVKTDQDGIWTYELEEELEDGKHEVYVASVNASGKILAKSNAIPFVVEAEAATLGEVLSPVIESKEAKGFFAQYVMQLTGLIIALGIILTVFIMGLRRKDAEEYGEYTHSWGDQNEVNE